MNLFFDARYTRTDYHDGISRYSVELGTALLKITPVTFLISNKGQKKWFPKDAQFITIHSPTSAKEPFTAFVLNKYHPDVVYSPMQTIGTIGRTYRSVLTIHDMIYYQYPKAPRSLPLPIRAGWWLYHQSYLPQRLLLKGGDIITTVSKTSADDLKKATMTKKPIHVVYNAPQKFSKYPVTQSGNLTSIVYMGSFMDYKNVETLIRGMQWLSDRTLHLLSKISKKRKDELLKLVPKNSTVIFHNGVSDDEYEKILSDNAVLVSASLNEGFGIPVSEAMAMGVPTVVSAIPVFQEVGGDGVLYFDPDSPKAFADEIKKLDDIEFRNQLITRARKQVSRFNWNDSAKVLLAAIKS